MSGLLALLLGGAVLAAGRRLFGRATGGVAMVLLWGTASIVLVAITPRVDVTLALYLFLGHYALLVALDPPEEGPGSPAWAGLAAVLLGMAVGVKLNALAYALALTPLAFWALWLRGGGAGALRSLGVCALLGAVAMAPWLLKNVALVGAPLYPFLADRTPAPWLDALFPGGSAAAAVAPAALRSLRMLRSPFDFWAVFFDPGRLTVEYEASFYVANRAFLLLPLGLLFRGRRRLAWLVLPPLAYLTLVILPFGRTNLRYLIPAAPALTLGVAWIVTQAARRWIPGKRERRWAILAVCLLATFPTGRAVWVWLGRTVALEHLVGTASAQRYRQTHHDPGVRIYAPVIRHVNTDVPDDATILMLFEARGFPLDRQVLQDNGIHNWPILAAALKAGSDPCLESAPFDHVLLATGVLGYYERRGLDLERLGWPRFGPFQARCLEPVWQSPGYVLFRRR